MELYKDIIASPHTLIAGTTGSGKSNVMNGIIREIMTSHTPAQADIYFIDPKVVELIDYRNTAFCKAFESDAENVPAMLDSLIAEMESRYQSMGDQHTKQYSGKRIYLIVDELADLMISPQNKAIKIKLQKILQKGRAAEIHIIAATQAPNRQIIPANLTLNFTNRLALRCISAIESRQIINQPGAENLPKYGKGLYFSPEGLVNVSIPLTPSNDDVIARWKKADPIRKPEAAEEVIYIAPRQRKQYNQGKTANAIRNIGFAMMFGGLLLGMII